MINSTMFVLLPSYLIKDAALLRFIAYDQLNIMFLEGSIVHKSERTNSINQKTVLGTLKA